MQKKVRDMDIIFLLDRSGSMAGMEEDTIGGYNDFIKKRKNIPNTKITTVLFDNEYEFIHKRESIEKVNKLTEKEYYVRGCTALLDAIGTTITSLEKEIKNNKVLFVITTDGLENASKEYNKNQIKKLIEKHSNWEFIYIGANIDSYSEGASIGISRNNIANYKKTSTGTRKLFESVNKISECIYMDKEIDETWKENLE